METKHLIIGVWSLQPEQIIDRISLLIELRIQHNCLANLPDFIAETDKLILKSYGKVKGPRIMKTILEKNRIGGLTLLISKSYF